MGLERWDPVRNKYVLYTEAVQHDRDCRRFPFKEIPKRIFLDTCIINLLIKFGTHVFECTPLRDGLDATRSYDIEALMHIFQVGSRANWSLVASRKTMEELSLTKDTDLREDLLEYASTIVNYGVVGEDCQFASEFGRKLIDTIFVAALHQRADQELIGNAIGYGCDAFCTCDRANRLRQMPLPILTPVEWWAHVKPWAGLWS